MVLQDVEISIRKIIPDEFLILKETIPPKYLSPLIRENEILYIYKQKKVQESEDIDSKTPFSDDTLQELDLTGQPLECPFSMNDSVQSEKMIVKKREEDDHCPLTLREAREIISFVNLNCDLKLPLFILTDGFDKNHTIALGSARKDGWFTRSWVTIEKFSQDTNTMTDVDKMVQNHYKQSQINPIHTESEVFAKYVIELTNEFDATFVTESLGHIEVNLSWKTPSFTIPLNEASVELTIESTITNENSAIAHLWDQLTLLYDYLEMIKTWQSDRKSKAPYSRDCIDFPNLRQDDVPLKSVKESVTQLLLEANQITGISLTGRNADLEKKTLEQIINTVTSDKKEQEFTDKLWNLAIQSSSYEEIRSCFEIVYQHVRNEASKPYMKTTNITRLSHVLRVCKDSSSHSTLILEPLELLVEIGIEKLKKEYISAYLLAKIATCEQLRIPSLSKFPEVKSDDWIDHCSKWITWLTRMHIVLQLMLVTETLMKSKTCIVPLTMLTLQHYLNEKSPIDQLIDPRTISSQSFSTPINARDILDLLNKKTPFNSWTLILHSAKNNRKVISAYHRNIDEIFPSSIALANDFEEDKNDLTNYVHYYCYDFHSVSDKLF